MLNTLTRVAKAIWSTIKKINQSMIEARNARAQWELDRHLRLQGYDNLTEYQKERLRYYERAHF